MRVLRFRLWVRGIAIAVMAVSVAVAVVVAIAEGVASWASLGAWSLAAVVAGFGWRCALHPRVVIDESSVTALNILRRHVVPLAEIVGVEPTYVGLRITTSSGAAVTSTVGQKSNWAVWRGRHTNADEVARSVAEAAATAQAWPVGEILAPPPSPAERRSTGWVMLSGLAVALAAMGLRIWSDHRAEEASHARDGAQGAPFGRTPGTPLPVLEPRLLDGSSTCFGAMGDATDTSVVDPDGMLTVLWAVPCDEPHVGQLVVEVPVDLGTRAEPDQPLLVERVPSACEEHLDLTQVTANLEVVWRVVSTQDPRYPTTRWASCGVVDADGGPLVARVSPAELLATSEG